MKSISMGYTPLQLIYQYYQCISNKKYVNSHSMSKAADKLSK